MSDLTRLMSQVSTGGVNGGAMEIPVEAQRFIEKVTFADPEDIWKSLRESLTEDWMALPVWARNLAFRCCAYSVLTTQKSWRKPDRIS